MHVLSSTPWKEPFEHQKFEQYFRVVLKDSRNYHREQRVKHSQVLQQERLNSVKPQLFLLILTSVPIETTTASFNSVSTSSASICWSWRPALSKYQVIKLNYWIHDLSRCRICVVKLIIWLVRHAIVNISLLFLNNQIHLLIIWIFG